jgi:hypothetical protein
MAPRTFVEVAENVVLVRLAPLRALNGDLQALLLVGSTRRIRLTKELHRALLILKGRIEQAAEGNNGKFKDTLVKRKKAQYS